jgi:hypothetical protein
VTQATGPRSARPRNWSSRRASRTSSRSCRSPRSRRTGRPENEKGPRAAGLRRGVAGAHYERVGQEGFWITRVAQVPDLDLDTKPFRWSSSRIASAVLMYLDLLEPPSRPTMSGYEIFGASIRRASLLPLSRITEERRCFAGAEPTCWLQIAEPDRRPTRAQRPGGEPNARAPQPTSPKGTPTRMGRQRQMANGLSEKSERQLSAVTAAAARSKHRRLPECVHPKQRLGSGVRDSRTGDGTFAFSYRCCSARLMTESPETGRPGLRSTRMRCGSAMTFVRESGAVDLEVAAQTVGLLFGDVKGLRERQLTFWERARRSTTVNFVLQRAAPLVRASKLRECPCARRAQRGTA